MVLSMSVPNRKDSTPPSADQEIILDYDPTTLEVTVSPEVVQTGATICFKGKYGNKVRVVFVSLFGDEIAQMADSEIRMLPIGGFYHFKCFFTTSGGEEIAGKTGGIIDVQPHRP
jgi:hypothetical protein